MTSTTSSASLARYSALVGATFVGTTAASAASVFTVFGAPYSTSDLLSAYTSPADNATLGAWTWDKNSSSSFLEIRASGTSSLSILASAPSFEPDRFVDFKTTIVSGFEIISFSYSVTGYGSGQVQWFQNSQFNVITGSGTVSEVTLSAGDVFGFRVSVNYSFSASSRELTISNLTATSASPIPEAASSATWIGLGVAGLVAMREMRRRPRATAAQA